jgi:L-ascorbate 6-phosphate lactonase
VAERTIELTWFGQAAFRFAAGQDRVLVDPFLSDRPDRRYRPPAVAADLADTTLVLCTHEHDDHLDLKFLRDLFAAGGRPHVVVPAPVVPFAVAGGLDESRLISAEPGAPISVGNVRVESLPVVHGVGGDQPVEYAFRSRGDPEGSFRFLGYAVEIGGVRIFHPGDTVVFPDFAGELRRLAPDVLLLPINGRDYMRDTFGWPGNMNEQEAAWLCREVQPSYVVPMHYDGFANNLGDPGRFVDALGDDHLTAVLLPSRGQKLTVAL